MPCTATIALEFISILKGVPFSPSQHVGYTFQAIGFWVLWFVTGILWSFAHHCTSFAVKWVSWSEALSTQIPCSRSDHSAGPRTVVLIGSCKQEKQILMQNMCWFHPRRSAVSFRRWGSSVGNLSPSDWLFSLSNRVILRAQCGSLLLAEWTFAVAIARSALVNGSSWFWLISSLCSFPYGYFIHGPIWPPLRWPTTGTG